jgi:hypothetical protein
MPHNLSEDEIKTISENTHGTLEQADERIFKPVSQIRYLKLIITFSHFY